MRALSVKQPWASLIACGAKDVENRTWRTAYRGPVLICASSSVDRDAVRHIDFRRYPWRQRDEILLIVSDPSRRPTGMAVAVVELVDIIDDSPSPWAVPGLQHWCLSKSRPVTPFPIKGKLGLFHPDGGFHLNAT